MKIIYFYYLLLLLLPSFGIASDLDSTNGSWNIQLRIDYGFIIAHRPQLEPLQEKHIKGFEITLARVSDGNHDWQNIFNYPDFGITIACFDLGSPTHLGNGIAAYPFVDFPLGNKSKKGLHFRYGMGLGYIEKKFNSYDNFKNAAIGSHLNGVIHFDLHIEKKLSHRFGLEVGAGITHFSNGSFSIPNLGINIATINLAIHHSFGKNSAVLRRQIPPVNKKPEIHIFAGGFLKKIIPPLGKTFFAFTLSAMRFKPINLKSAWGLGSDIFFDNSISERINSKEGKEATNINNFRAGIHGAYHLTVGKMGIMFNMGFYLYNALKNDGNIYHRICLRYYLKKTFICLNLKTHFARADFIELGYGFRLIK